MNAEIIAIGTELLLGDVLDTNTNFLAGKLTGLGVSVDYATSVGDNSTRMREVLYNALNRVDLIIVTGGLGPTCDDFTRDVIAEVTQRPLQLHKNSVERIKGFFTRINKPMSENNLRQALLPAGSIPIINPTGTAPGFILNLQEKSIIVMPGVPSETKAMWDTMVEGFLDEKLGSDRPKIISKNLRCYGISESSLEDRIRDIVEKIEKDGSISIAFLPGNAEIVVRLTAKGANQEEMENTLETYHKLISERLSEIVYGLEKESMEMLVVNLLKKNAKTVALAESCTGGLVSHRITNVSGASDCLLQTIVSYSNEAKIKTLGVPAETIAAHGAVSEQTALAMADGVRMLAGSNYGLAITGIAGPSGGTEDKPVGLVYIALSTQDRGTQVERLQFFGEREQVKWRTSQAALDILRKELLR